MKWYNRFLSASALVNDTLVGQITFANLQVERIFGLIKEEITSCTYNAPPWQITDEDD